MGERVCAVCGVDISDKRSSSITCSSSCSSKRSNRILSEKLRLSRIAKLCPVCGNEFIEGRSDQVYCSWRCRSKNRAPARLAQQNNNPTASVRSYVRGYYGIEDPPEELIACLVEVRKLKRVAKEMQE